VVNAVPVTPRTRWRSRICADGSLWFAALSLPQLRFAEPIPLGTTNLVLAMASSTLASPSKRVPPSRVPPHRHTLYPDRFLLGRGRLSPRALPRLNPRTVLRARRLHLDELDAAGVPGTVGSSRPWYPGCSTSRARRQLGAHPFLDHSPNTQCGHLTSSSERGLPGTRARRCVVPRPTSPPVGPPD